MTCELTSRPLGRLGVRRALRGVFKVWILASVFAGSARAADAPADIDEDPPEVLSAFEVTAAGSEFRNWSKVGSPNFTIYTDAPVKEALTMLQQLEMLHFVVQAFFNREANVRAPMIFVLPTARSDWRKLQAKGGLIEWKTAISGSSGRVAELVVAQYDWQHSGPHLIWSAAARGEIERLNIETTTWFHYGAGAFFETARFTPDTVVIGHASRRAMWMQSEGAIEWPRFFSITTQSPEFTKDSDMVHRYFGQCAAFVQYMLANPDPIWTPRLLIWNAALEAGREPTEELFQQVFTQDWAEWDKTMRDYMENGRFTVHNVRFPDAVRDVVRTPLSLTTTEMRELFVLAQVIIQDVPESTAALDSLLAQGLKTESLRELFVEACLTRRHRAGAQEQMRRLIAAGTTNPLVYVRAAQRLVSEQKTSDSIHGRIDLATKNQVRAWCRHALELESLLLDANDTLAWAEARGPSVGPEELAIIGEVCRRLEGNGATDWAIAALAIARWRAGRPDSARKACATLLESPFAEERLRDIARELVAELDAGR